MRDWAGHHGYGEEVVVVKTGLVDDLALLDYGVASVAAQGETVSGDLHLVHPIPGGVVAAVVDGAGHGVDAGSAARMAVEILRAHAGHEGVIPVIERCHLQLKGTRGVVLSVATICGYEDTMTWLCG